MQVWFSIIPGHGHFFPLLPLAHALEAGGHEVTFGTSKSYGETVEAHGFASIDVGLDYTQGSEMDAEGQADGVEKLMFVDGPPATVDSYLQIFEDRRPDVMLVDPVDFGAMTVCELEEMNWGCVLNGVIPPILAGNLPFDRIDRAGAIEEWKLSKRLRDRYDVPDPDLVETERSYDRTLVLSMVPPSLEPWPLKWRSHTAHPLRPEIHRSDSDDFWLDEIPADLPIITISLGTLFGTPQLYRRAALAALETGARVIAATSFEIEIDNDRLITTNWVSMDRLMDRSDVIIHHAGWGSTVGALASGTPSVIMPLGAEQFINAARLQATGSVARIDRQDDTATMTTRIKQMLEDPVYRLNSERLRDEIEEMPGASEVVPLIERLGADGPPILNR